MSNALPLSMSNVSSRKAPPAPQSHWTLVPVGRPTPRPAPARVAEVVVPPPAPVNLSLSERMLVARDRIRAAAEAGVRIRSYEVALDLDMSEFHFARQFRTAFGTSPHVYYDAVRADRARVMLRDGVGESEVARRIGLRRPAELRSLLNKRAEADCAR